MQFLDPTEVWFEGTGFIGEWRENADQFWELSLEMLEVAEHRSECKSGPEGSLAAFPLVLRA